LCCEVFSPASPDRKVSFLRLHPSSKLDGFRRREMKTLKSIFLINALVSFGLLTLVMVMALTKPLHNHGQKGGITKGLVPSLAPSSTKTLFFEINQLATPTSKTHTAVAGAQTTAENTLSSFCLYVPILLYHRVGPVGNQTSLTVDIEYFDKQMSHLVSSGYQTISADQLAQALINHQQLPPKSVVITMDDGYQGIYTGAYPIIQKYHVTINLMIPTGLLENPGYLTWPQLKEMVGSGLVFAYDHTWSHSALASASKEKIQFEVLTAKKQLEENLGKKVDIFTYPYGSENQQVIDILRLNGFIAAFSTIPGATQCDSFIMNLHRTRIGNVPLSAYGL